MKSLFIYDGLTPEHCTEQRLEEYKITTMPVAGVEVRIMDNHGTPTPVAFFNDDSRCDGILYKVPDELLAQFDALHPQPLYIHETIDFQQYGMWSTCVVYMGNPEYWDVAT